MDNSLNSQNSRVGIKICSDLATMRQFPRRKSNNGSKFRMSSESSVKSEAEGDGMVKSMIMKDPKEKMETRPRNGSLEKSIA